jgi:hypothetical protein
MLVGVYVSHVLRSPETACVCILYAEWLETSLNALQVNKYPRR